MDFENSSLILDVSNLRVGFKEKKKDLIAVDGIDMRLRQGSVFGLVGESGCGKSTLGNSLAGLLPIQGGELFYQGNSALRKNRLQRSVFQNKVQVIFQDPYSCLNPKHTVYEILSFPLLYHEICKRAEVKLSLIHI